MRLLNNNKQYLGWFLVFIIAAVVSSGGLICHSPEIAQATSENHDNALYGQAVQFKTFDLSRDCHGETEFLALENAPTLVFANSQNQKPFNQKKLFIAGDAFPEADLIPPKHEREIIHPFNSPPSQQTERLIKVVKIE